MRRNFGRWGGLEESITILPMYRDPIGSNNKAKAISAELLELNFGQKQWYFGQIQFFIVANTVVFWANTVVF